MMEASFSRLNPTYFSVRRLLLGALVILSVIIASCVASSVSGNGGGVSRKVQPKDHQNVEKDGFEIEASDVVQITNENYAKTIKQGTWFVKFYTDTCHLCRQLQPTWEELATDLKGEVMVGQVNCQTDMALCRRFQVRAYPTLVHIRNRKCRVYKGKSRSKADLAQFAVKGYKMTPAISALKSPFGPIENFKAYLVRGIHFVHKFVMEQVESGTPKWVLILMSVGAVVVMTIIFALVIVLSYPDRPKRD